MLSIIIFSFFVFFLFLFFSFHYFKFLVLLKYWSVRHHINQHQLYVFFLFLFIYLFILIMFSSISLSFHMFPLLVGLLDQKKHAQPPSFFLGFKNHHSFSGLSVTFHFTPPSLHLQCGPESEWAHWFRALHF